MPLWTKTSPPKWVPTAAQTNSGWTDPSTHEVYVAIRGLADNQAALITGIRVDATAYKIGDTLKAYVHFSEPVTVVGTPQLTLVFNAQSRVINYTSGTGTSVLEFDYTVAAGDTATAAQVTATSPVALNSGTITDTNGSSPLAAVRTFTSAAYVDGATLGGYPLNLVVVDATRPTVGSAALVSSAHATAPVTGDILTLTLTASENVVVTGLPQVVLNVNLTVRQLVYDAASSTATALKFKYTVVGGDAATATQLTVGTLGLNSGTIKDVAGNTATLTFSAPNLTAWTVN